MKILHILYSGLGGHGNVFFSMKAADTQNKYTYEALFNGIEEVKEEYLAKCTNENIDWQFVKKKQGLDFGFFVKLYKAIKKSKPPIIFLHGGAAIIPAWVYKLTNRKVKLVVRETQANHLKTTIDWIYLITSMLLTDKMVYLSEEYRQQVQKKLRLIYVKKKTVVIPNGLNLNDFVPGLESNTSIEFKIGMQSRLVAIKDHITLIKAFNNVQQKTTNNIKLYVAGDGNYTEVLKALVTELDLTDKVIFTGLLGEKDLIAFLQSLNIYIHATLGETMSTAIMQAMACAKPIIASNVDGINNMIIDNETGILVNAQNVTQLENAIEKLVGNVNERERLAKNALIFAQQNFSSQLMFKRYSEYCFS